MSVAVSATASTSADPHFTGRTNSPVEFELGEAGQPVPPVHKVLATYQMSDRWELRDLLRELHCWVEIFVCQFKLTISDIALRVDGISWHHLGHFQRGRNGFGLAGEIAINRRHLDKKEFWEVLGTLLHELLHAWQEVHGRPAKSKRQYHNLQFRRKAAEVGLIVDRRGCQQYEPEGAFIRLLRQYGVNVPALPAPSPQPVGASKLKLYVCRCNPPFRVRVARSGFRATCRNCGREFVQADCAKNGPEREAVAARP